MISTRGRYALRVLIDLAENDNGGYIPMKTVAERLGISLKYLEQITPLLIKERYVESASGKNGGYRLCRPADRCVVGDVLRLTEGDLAPVACLACDAKQCDRAETCRTLPMWKEYDELTSKYFDGITVADLMKKQ